jgi:hypothetical protein
MIPTTFTFPCCCNTLASPIAVASSHHRDKSVSMITAGPVGRGAVLTVGAADAGVVSVRDADFDDPDEHPLDAIVTSTAVTTAGAADTTRRRRPRSISFIGAPRATGVAPPSLH